MGLLEALFADGARPTKRWLADQIKAGAIPHYKIGKLVRFDLEQVRASLGKKQAVRSIQKDNCA